MLRPKNFLHPAKAVSPMQACALHLCHRTPRRCRARVGAGHFCGSFGLTPRLLALTTARTAHLFGRLRHPRPIITDPTQRFPTNPEAASYQWLVGTRCAASVESFVPALAAAPVLSPTPKAPAALGKVAGMNALVPEMNRVKILNAVVELQKREAAAVEEG